MQSILPYIPQVLQILLFLIMLGMGTTLTLGDFNRVGKYPKAVMIGLLCQIIFLPIIGFGIVSVLPLEAVFAVGIMVLASSPGGAVSNLFSHLSKGDTALSISLTAISSLITVLSIPFIINWALSQYMDQTGIDLQLPIGKTIINIIKLTALPVAIGMMINYKFPKTTKAGNKLIAWISVIIIVLALILIYIKLGEIGDVWSFIHQCLLAVLILNVVTLAIGFFSARLAGLDIKQSVSISIETGMQNNVLAMAIAISPALLDNPLMAVPAGVYGLLMNTTAIAMVFFYRKLIEKSEIENS